MLKSVFLNFNAMCLSVVLIAGAALCGFDWYTDRQQAITWGNQCLYQSYDASGEVKLKKWELMVTPDAFVRFRKTYLSGRQEYYSFHLRSFTDVDYLGTVTKGTLRIKTKADDIIVQTYHDPKGDVDSMTTFVNIPVKNMAAERLDSLLTTLNYLKNTH